MLQIEKQLVEEIDGGAHAGDDQTRDHADQRCERDQARFPRSDDGAQAPRYFDSAGDFSGQGAPAGPMNVE